MDIARERIEPASVPAPEPGHSADLRERLRRGSRLIAWLAIGAPILLLCARAVEPLLGPVAPPVMHARTLVCMLLAGISLRAWHTGRAGRTERLMAVAVALTGLVTLAHYALAPAGAAQEALYGRGMLVDLVSPGRLSLPSSMILTLIGLALVGLHADWPAARVEAAAATGAFLALLALIGHLYHASELFAPLSRRGIAVAPSVMLGALCLGVLVARSDRGLVALGASERTAGRVVRGLLGPIVIAPVLVGFVSLGGVRARLYDTEMGVALVVAATIAVLSCLALVHAESVRRAEADLDELNARLVQAHRIDSASHLAGWLCHEFNNLMTVIRGYSALILENPGGPSVREYAREVDAAARDCVHVIRKLLQFSSHEIARVEPVDLAQVVAALEPALGPMVGRAVQIELALASGAMVRANRQLVQHVLVQLALNARDAMPDGGTLAIAVANGPDGLVHLTVADTGCGMPADVRARAFEPFFTTKDRGRGTGLGLATVFGVVKQLGGTIAIESREAAGTRVDVALPPAGAARAASE